MSRWRKLRIEAKGKLFSLLRKVIIQTKKQEHHKLKIAAWNIQTSNEQEEEYDTILNKYTGIKQSVEKKEGIQQLTDGLFIRSSGEVEAESGIVTETEFQRNIVDWKR